VPHLVRYQGQAVDSAGMPLQGPYTLTFRLYDADTAGTIVWQEQQANVPLNKGHFSVLLGQVTALNVDWSQSLWLSVQVGTDPELLPRQRITSVPLAIRSEVAEGLVTQITTSTITDDANKLVPSGAIILWDGVSCPAGYTRLAAYDNYFLVGSSTAGTSGGSNTHDHVGVTGNHVLTINEIPSHTHDGIQRAVNGGGNQFGNGEWNSGNNQSDSTQATGGGAGHTHAIAPADNRPLFKTILLCKSS
jgi:hypothetical protein